MRFFGLARSGQRALGAMLLTAFVASFLVMTASAAGAHHPTLATADIVCSANGYQVDFTSRTWSQNNPGGTNPDIQVEVRLPNSGNTWLDLLDPTIGGSITSNESAVTAGNGEYSDPDRQFTGRFYVPSDRQGTVRIRVTAVGAWGNGSGGGQHRNIDVDLPAKGACSSPSAAVTYQCVAGTGSVVVEVANGGFDAVDFDIVISGPSGVVESQTLADHDSASGVGTVNATDLPDGTYSVAVTADGQPIAVSGGNQADLHCSAAVGDRAWQDWNRNGIQDNGEPDQPVASITLSNGDTDTDGDGSYLFDGLDPDQNYTVTFADVPGLVRAPADAGDDAADSDADGAGVAIVDDLDPGETDRTVDAGYWLAGPPPVCTTGDVVWTNSVDLGNVGPINGLPATNVRFVTGSKVTHTLPGPLPSVFDDAVVITSVEAASWDGYWNRPNTSPLQAMEQWRVVFTLDGTPVGATGYTADLADGVYTASWTGLLDLGGGLTLPNGANGIVLEHISVNTAVPTAESVVPTSLCVSVSPVPGSIGDRVWYDDDGDGVQDPGENGINGVTVKLLDDGGNVIATDVTSGDGLYLFENLPPGDYTVMVDDTTLPADLTQTYDLDGTLDHTSQEALSADEHTRVHDFGYQRLGAIGDRVWYDADTDGVQDPGEVGINGVTVRLLDSGGATLGTTVTFGDGDYLFGNLPEGTYTVVVDDSTLPADLTQTYDYDGLASPHRSTYALGAGETNRDQDFGYYKPPASLGDFVWHDLDADGVQDPGEPGIPGVTVTLYTSGGATVGSTVTGAAGDYSFTGLDPDEDYVVEFTLLGGAFTDADQGGDDAADSDADPTDGRSPVVALDPGQHDPTIDAGVVSLTPSVDIEKDTNGDDADNPTGPIVPVDSTVTWTYVITNDGELDLTDVVVTDDQGEVPVRDDSTDVGADDILSVGESWTYTATGVATQGQYANLGTVTGNPRWNGQPATDVYGDPLDPVTDDDPSHYLGYVPGEASIDIEKATNGFDADSADPNVNPIPEVPLGGTVTWTYVVTNTSDTFWMADIEVTDDIIGAICTIDGPLAPFDTATCEYTGTATVGAYENIGSVIGTPVDDQGDRATNPDGSEIPEPTDDDPSHYVGLELASLGDRVWFDVDADGAQDAGEPGVGGVEVVLWTVDGSGLPDTQIGTTTTDGDGMYRFDDLDPTVDYVVQFKVGPLTTPDAADDDVDSDADPATGLSHVIDLDPGEHDPTIDAGIATSALGDFVWFDEDADGLQSPGEVGVEGMTVNLIQNGSVVATTTTDADGFYLFDGLLPGDYQVEFVLFDPYDGFTTNDNGADDVDSDADQNTGRSPVVTLGLGEVDLTIDAGLVVDEEVGGEVEEPTPTPTPTPTPNDPTPLAFTGANSTQLALVGLGLVVAGVGLVIGTRRRDGADA